MEPQPRSNAKRVTLMMVLIVVASAMCTSLSLLDLQVRVSGHTIVPPDAIGFIALTTVYAFLATRVSLPWYYAGWILVPFIGIYAVWKISWRVAYLPWRDWDLRPGEERGPFDVAHDLYGVRERMVPIKTD